MNDHFSPKLFNNFTKIISLKRQQERCRGRERNEDWFRWKCPTYVTEREKSARWNHLCPTYVYLHTAGALRLFVYTWTMICSKERAPNCVNSIFTCCRGLDSGHSHSQTLYSTTWWGQEKERGWEKVKEGLKLRIIIEWVEAKQRNRCAKN